ncbi:ABC transporter substrate-binding protein [Desulfobulbus alkaliphilus]|uniref:ABC transporter substrate-binding protein n=1 Tax=Desulfobulbus alkaliphilus TaxID=869814 RepID=UPI00196389DD|nr:ABC transporter substrate-binding protein [Desulfobulbus alkaliphilus]MBM9537066.1 ABC transporter substrate-binding protein [Desulfobulbus alkaliphilus]
MSTARVQLSRIQVLEKNSMQAGLVSSWVLVFFVLALCCPLAGIASLQSQEPRPVRLALVLAQTGIAMEAELPAMQAAQLAMEEINRAGGILGHPLEILFFDNQSTPLGAKQAAEQAVQAGVLGVIGPFRSSHALAAAPVLQGARIPMITPIATQPEITRIGDCIFRVCITDDLQGLLVARFARTRLSARTAIVLTNINEAYSLTLADTFSTSFEAAGGKVIRRGGYKGSDADFTALLEPLRELRPDVVFIPGYHRDSGLLMLQAVQMGIRSVFLGGDGWGEPMRRYGGEAVVGAYYMAHYHPDVPSGENRVLQRLYRQRFGQEIQMNLIPLTYDAILLFADAARRAGELDREAIRRTLAATADFQGATGTITFDATGDPIAKETFMLTFTPDNTALVEVMGR